jgi:hypothetical protein
VKKNDGREGMMEGTLWTYVEMWEWNSPV